MKRQNIVAEQPPEVSKRKVDPHRKVTEKFPLVQLKLQVVTLQADLQS